MISKLALSDKRYVTDKIWKRNGGNGKVTVKTKNEIGFGKKWSWPNRIFPYAPGRNEEKGPKLSFGIVCRQGFETGTSQTHVLDLPKHMFQPGTAKPARQCTVYSSQCLRGHATSSFIDVTKQRHCDGLIGMSSGWTAFDIGLGHIQYITN